MRFISTRDSTVAVSGVQAIAQGISVESGLFVPERFPEISVETLAQMEKQNYRERAYTIISEFLPEFSKEELRTAIDAAYGKNFSDPRIAPVVHLKDNQFLLELWHGPTCAFKDMALQLLPQLLTLSLSKVAPGKEAVILVATSGDTGKAALDGFRNVEGTRLLVFYPEGGVSRIQKLQMATQEGENLSVFAVEGNFDDTQTAVKNIFANQELLEELAGKDLMFSSANSINWGRLMPQIVYYFSAYLDMVNAEEISLGDSINVCVPTGNFGNILAAYYAKRMGLPLGKLICASNENNVLTDFIETGTYDRNRSFQLTNSPSMDILISSNLERLLFELEQRNDKTVANLMNALSIHGKYTVSPEAKAQMDKDFYGGYCTEEETLATIAEVFKTEEYLCDTHTAVAVKVYQDYLEKTGDDTPVVIVSTANPYKFADSILEAFMPDANPADEFNTLEILHKISRMRVPPQISGLKHKKIRFSTTISKAEMMNAVRRVIEL